MVVPHLLKIGTYEELFSNARVRHAIHVPTHAVAAFKKGYISLSDSKAIWGAANGPKEIGAVKFTQARPEISLC